MMPFGLKNAGSTKEAQVAPKRIQVLVWSRFGKVMPFGLKNAGSTEEAQVAPKRVQVLVWSRFGKVFGLYGDSQGNCGEP